MVAHAARVDVGYVSQPISRRDDELKINYFKKILEVATIVYYGKLWKTIKIK